MGRVLQLSNSANWEQVWSEQRYAVTVTPTYTAPIPQIDVPLLFDTHVLAVYITTEIPEGREWYFAGYLYQKFQLGLIVGGMPDADTIGFRRLNLNKVQFITFNKMTSNYAISISVPRWFKFAQITIWKYTGIDYDSIDVAIERIEQKLDLLELFENQNPEEV